MAGLLDNINKAVTAAAERNHRDFVQESEISALQLLVEIRDIMKENNILLQQLVSSSNLENTKANRNNNALSKRNEGIQSRNK
ncbi:hypothetical protein ACFSJM_00410 [Lactococcus formosensis subsp. bovis]|uniref:hypothetical protein n=1 Tax=Lactococcus formosensis TaxID=1281486 RepID=UPI001BCB27B2|nr:hypothetical protein [Lactococcus formosensis]